MAKKFIREKVLRKCQGFGIHKDGTTRKKVKILDTSVRTESGEAYCLGWSSVVSETGKAIAEETREKMDEVISALAVEDTKIEIWKKLEYYMNDRAANEKKSSRLIDEWKDEMLASHGEDATVVEHLHCAAHVLLGFHSYVITSIKKLDLTSSTDIKHPILMLLKDASDIFGPVGDYRGLRNEWEALCMQDGKKSWIKGYKDNRFNGLFEVAAQVFHHHRDFWKLLESHKNKNAKLTRLFKALSDTNLIVLIECLGLFFHSVTGPFWTMVISEKTSHPEFTRIIIKLKDSLKTCSEDPNYFFTPESFSFLDKFGATSAGTKEKMSSSVCSDSMRSIMSAVSEGMHTALCTQLKDVLESKKDIQARAPLTNLICERHFGHLDASQRRWPHGSLHHHSSVILLKQTRKRMKSWFEALEESEKDQLMKKARTESKKLRRKHQERDREAVMLSLKFNPRDEEEPEVDMKEGQMIAVACEDAWYPAVVQRESLAGQDICVSFAGLGKALGSFYWPTGKDVHTVSRRSVVEHNLEYVPQAGGRYWRVTNSTEIQRKFKKFK